ncbi:MAG: hypothetical protein ACJ8C4_05075 [Gemmataceae bacterium]
MFDCLRKLFTKTPDEKYIENVRRLRIIRLRQRRWWITFHIVLITAIIGMTFWANEMMLNFGQMGMQGGQLGLLIGMIIGAKLGLLLIVQFWHCAQVIFFDDRSAQLMLRYFDALKALQNEGLTQVPNDPVYVESK